VEAAIRKLCEEQDFDIRLKAGYSQMDFVLVTTIAVPSFTDVQLARGSLSPPSSSKGMKDK